MTFEDACTVLKITPDPDWGYRFDGEMQEDLEHGLMEAILKWDGCVMPEEGWTFLRHALEAFSVSGPIPWDDDREARAAIWAAQHRGIFHTTGIFVVLWYALLAPGITRHSGQDTGHDGSMLTEKGEAVLALMRALEEDGG